MVVRINNSKYTVNVRNHIQGGGNKYTVELWSRTAQCVETVRSCDRSRVHTFTERRASCYDYKVISPRHTSWYLSGSFERTCNQLQGCRHFSRCCGENDTSCTKVLFLYAVNSLSVIQSSNLTHNVRVDSGE